MKINKSRLIEALLTLLGVAYLGLPVFLAITCDRGQHEVTYTGTIKVLVPDE